MEYLIDLITEAGLGPVLVGTAFRIVQLLILWHIRRSVERADPLTDIGFRPVAL